MNEANGLHPLGLSVTTHRLCGLEEMIDLSETGIGIRVVNECIEQLHGVPDTHPGAPLLAEVGTHLDVEFYSLFFCSIPNEFAI